MDQVVASLQLRYEAEINQVIEQLDLMGMRPETEVRVYPEPNGWCATVLVGGLVLVFVWRYDHFTINVHPFSGFYPNGGLIFEGKADYG